MKILFVSIALGATIVSTAAAAQAQGGERGQYMQRDQTRAESKQRADMMFQMLDSNRDGSVTKAEADQAMERLLAAGGDDNSDRRAARIQRMIDQAFANSPTLTQVQMEAQALARFDAADLNHDGTLTTAEREQVRAQRQQAAPAAAPAVNPQ